MNLHNIQIDKVFKNYNELCTAIDEPFKQGGKARQLQLLDWQRYFSYSKDGYKFIITDIYTEPKSKENHRGKSTKSKSDNDKRHKNGSNSPILTYMTNAVCGALDAELFIHSSESQIIRQLGLVCDDFNLYRYQFDDYIYHVVDGQEEKYFDDDKRFFLDYCSTVMNSYRQRLKTVFKKLSALPTIQIKNDYAYSYKKGGKYYVTEFIDDESTINEISKLSHNLELDYDVNQDSEKWKIYSNKKKCDEFNNAFLKKIQKLLKRDDIESCYKTVYIKSEINTDFSSIETKIDDYDKFNAEFKTAQMKFAEDKIESVFKHKNFKTLIYNHDVICNDIIEDCKSLIKY